MYSSSFHLLVRCRPLHWLSFFVLIVCPFALLAAGKCSNGVDVDGRCDCIEDYLLPYCLYRAEDSVPMRLWVQHQTSLFIPSDFIAAFCAALQLDEVTPQVQFEYSIPGRVVLAGSASAADHLLQVVVTVPGWVAQVWVSFAFEVELVESSRRSWDCLGPRCDFSVLALGDITSAPTEVLPYRQEWMRFFISANQTSYSGMPGWSIGFPHVVWAAVAGVLSLALLAVERVVLFNTERHVGEAVQAPVLAGPFSSLSNPEQKPLLNEEWKQTTWDEEAKCRSFNKSKIEDIEMQTL